MKLMMTCSLLLAGTNAAAAGDPTRSELLPSGKWQVEYAKSSCIISRAFGEQGQQTLFGLKPAPNSEVVALLIVQPSAKGRGVRGEAQVRLTGGFVPEFADYVSVTAKGMRVTTISLPRTALEVLAKGEGIAIKADTWVDVALHPTGFDKALAAMKECEADLLASWGFDRAAQAAVAKPPQGSLRGLFRPDDYPMDLLEGGIGGDVGIRLRVEPDGSISECAVIESSGTPALDKHTCTLAKRRAQFAPAIGHDGKPCWSFTFGRVSWMTS